MALKRVAFQGERGAFSETAVSTLIGGRFTPVPCPTFEDVFASVAKCRADRAVIPIENSLAGSVIANYDLLVRHSLHIIGESQLRVVHCLMAKPEAERRRIVQVYSHPVALEQCRRFLRRYRRMKPIPYYDTAGAARLVAESDDDNIAAIAGPLAAAAYGLRILRRSIEDDPTNSTRFLLLARRRSEVRGRAKTSLVFALPHEPGALFKALSVFALRDINLTKLESRPSRSRRWTYHFHVDIEGNANDKNIRNALSHLQETAPFLKVLGSYPMRVRGSRGE